MRLSIRRISAAISEAVRYANGDRIVGHDGEVADCPIVVRVVRDELGKILVALQM